MMKIAIRQQRHRLKEEYFDPFPLHHVTKTSPVKLTTDEDWLKLVESWKTPKKMVWEPTLAMYMILWHLCNNLNCVYNAGGMPKKQGEPGQGQVPCNNRLM